MRSLMDYKMCTTPKFNTGMKKDTVTKMQEILGKRMPLDKLIGKFLGF